MSLQEPAPVPSKFKIHQTPSAGRCLLASSPLAPHTTILTTGPPILSVIMREYRREVCAFCYAYNRGRNLPIWSSSTSKAFCSEQCRSMWESATGDEGLQCWEVLEAYVKRKGGREVVMGDADARRPMEGDVEMAWDEVRELGQRVRQAKEASGIDEQVSKRHRKALNEALEAKGRVVDADVLSLLLAGVLLHYQHASTSTPPAISCTELTMDSPNPTDQTLSPWTRLLTLARTPTPYPTPQNLLAHTHAYLLLLSLLPSHISPSITPTNCIFIPAHETHNSFGLRSLDDAGDEFLGYGVWAEASLFNHSCEPNVGKGRGGGCVRGEGGVLGEMDGEGKDGDEVKGESGDEEEMRSVRRTWSFWTTRDVEEGEELAISYLGGEEATLGVGERRARLMATWGFECCCGKCLREAA